MVHGAPSESDVTPVASVPDHELTPAHLPSVQGTGGADIKPSHLRSMIGSLDSVFYLICALAVLGLVISLYALIKQNNAYFEREFEQLQQETAALNARLAELNETSLATEVDASQLVHNTATKPADNIITTHVQTPLDAATGELTEPVVNMVTAPADEEAPDTVTADTVIEDNPAVTDITTDISTPTDITTAADVANVVEQAVPPVANTTPPEQSVTGIDVLRTELQALRDAVASQAGQITQLLEDNRLLQDTVSAAAPRPEVEDDDAAHSIDHVDADNHVDVDSDVDALPSVTPVTVSKAPVVDLQNALTSAADADQQLAHAYDAYQQQDYASALARYERVIAFDPYHRDANLGAAASAYLSGQADVAVQRYRHLLSLDALDTAAFTGLLRLAAQYPQHAIIELELQQHAEYHGNPSVLTAALGDHFARLQRWRDAEAAYARALAGHVVNADLTFNYAVVLDTLGQSQRAATYYRQALDMDTDNDALFDRQAAAMRLQSISGDGPSSD
ncbi:MAG: tetratricopeptide repeat protein [Pseudomonadota bacterium]